MRPDLIFLLCIVMIQLGCGQDPAEPAGEKKLMNNSKTNQHQLVKGTRVYLIPPPGFYPSTAMAGFTNGETSYIYVMDTEGKDYRVCAPDFTKEYFEKRGRKVLDYREDTINGYPARMVTMDNDAYSRSFMMIFGDSSFATVVKSGFPKYDEASEKAMLHVIQGIYYDKHMKQDDSADIHFSVVDNLSRFKHWKSIDGMHFYSINGEDPAKDPGRTLFILQMPSDGPQSLQRFAEKMFAKMAEGQGTGFDPGDSYIVGQNDGTLTCELESIGEKNGRNVLVYSYVIDGKDCIVTIGGIAKKDVYQSLEAFRRFSAAVRIRK